MSYLEDIEAKRQSRAAIRQQQDVTEPLNSMDSGIKELHSGIKQLEKVLQSATNIDKLSEAVISVSKIEGKQGKTGKQGVQGKPGKEAKTPVKGKDYFTAAEIKAISKDIMGRIRVPIDGKTPVKGVDYFTDAEIKRIISHILTKIPKPKDGKDGKDAEKYELNYERLIKDVVKRIPKPKDGRDGVNTFVTNGKNPYATVGYGSLSDLVAGSNITIDRTDPKHPVISATGGSGGSPAGSDTQVQFNDGGSFGAEGDLSFEKTPNRLNVGASTSSSNGIIVVGGSGTGTGDITGGGGALNVTGGDLTLASNPTHRVSIKTNTVERVGIENDGSITMTTPGVSVTGPITAPELQITDGSVKRYRFRTDGTDLDVSAYGKDLYISTYDDYTGTNQRQYVQYGAMFVFEKHYKKTIWDDSGDFMIIDPTAGVIINEQGSDRDTRVEGDTDQNLVFVDASTDRVGIGNGSPAVKLDVTGEIRASTAGTNSTSVVTVGGTQTLTNKSIAIIKPASDSTTGVQVTKADGTTNIVTVDTTNKRLGILATSGLPTHSLTLGSTADGIVLYNTSDQTTNYERVRQYWSGNIYFISTENGGTGTERAIRIGDSNNYFQHNGPGTPKLSFVSSSGSATSTGTSFAHTSSSSSGSQNSVSILPTINQSSTAGYTAFLVNPTESATGSGTKLLADFQVGSVSKVKIDNGGRITSSDISASETGAGANPTITALMDSSAANQPAILAKNNTNFAHGGNIIKAQMVNATDSGDVVRIENAGTGNSLVVGTSSTVLTKIAGNGVIFPVQAATVSAPAYVKGGMYFDTTLNKLRIGGATGWESVTSV